MFLNEVSLENSVITEQSNKAMDSTCVSGGGGKFECFHSEFRKICIIKKSRKRHTMEEN